MVCSGLVGSLVFARAPVRKGGELHLLGELL
jgi:hypothetical protein